MAQHNAPRAAQRLRWWSWVHTVSSLVCTLWLLLACISGLPLVFTDEIEAWGQPAPAAHAPGQEANIDAILAEALRRHPGEWPEYVVRDDEEPVVVVGLKPTLDAAASQIHRLRFDARSGALLEQVAAAGSGVTAMQLLRGLHTDLFLGLPGGLFMGLMALLFVVAMVSGVVLYAPFMAGRRFGTVRHGRSARIVWLDWHNLLGMVLLVWALLVGVTGAFNQLAKPLFARWTQTQVLPLAQQLAAQQSGPGGDALLAGGAASATAGWASLRAAIATAEQAAPGSRIGTMLMPGSRYGSPHHYLLWAAGSTPLTARLLQPVLVDAATGELAGVVPMPWYLRTLELSRPLHFGDYGGLPLKLLWLVLDVGAIVVLGSGLWLWVDRRRRARRPQRLPEAAPH